MHKRHSQTPKIQLMISAWSLVHACVATVASLTKEMTPITWYVAIFSKGVSITKLAYYTHVTVDSDKSCLSQQFAAHQARPTMMNPPPPVTTETKVKWRIFIWIARNPHCTIQASCTSCYIQFTQILPTCTWYCPQELGCVMIPDVNSLLVTVL